MAVDEFEEQAHMLMSSLYNDAFGFNVFKIVY